MPTQGTEERALNDSACAAEIRELCVQFQQAIAALVSDDVTALETSTAVQNSLLESLQNRLGAKTPGPQSFPLLTAADCKELSSLTRIYSSLLQRALRTSRLRAALCQTYKQNFPSASQPVGASGWSCEV